MTRGLFCSCYWRKKRLHIISLISTVVVRVFPTTVGLTHCGDKDKVVGSIPTLGLLLLFVVFLWLCVFRLLAFVFALRYRQLPKPSA